jgi:ATP-binding cassette subfamily B protein
MAAEPSAASAWSLLLAHIRPHRRALVAGGALALAGGCAALAQPLAAKAVIDALAHDDGVLRPVLVLTGLVVVGALLSATSLFVLERTAERVVLRARRRLIGRLLTLRIGELDRLAPGDLLSRVTSDTVLLRTVATTSVVDAITAALMLVGAVVLMGVVDLPLLAVTAGVLVAAALLVVVVLPRLGRAMERAQGAVGAMGAELERALGALRTVKASGAEAREAAAVDAAAQEAYRRGVDVAGLTAVSGVAGGAGLQVAFLAVLGVGGARVAEGSLDVASLVAFLLYVFFLAEPIASLTMAATQLQAGLAAVRRMREVDDLAVEPPPGPPAAAGGGPAEVRFGDVRFRYRPELPAVLDGVTFTASAGELTAIVGPSGAGKTTLFALLERFYDPVAGVVAVDGRPVGDWPLAQLRATLGYVEQDAPVLAGTLRDNLLLAAPGADEAALGEVLARTRLDGLVASLPDGLDAPVGPHGTTLSGGERQRVAIARALLRRPRVLLLDEATSQLDAVNERALRDVVADIARTTTVLVVAHRLSTVVGADRIVVLDAGRVRAVGTHDELVAGDALYRSLSATQLVQGAG